MVKHVFENTFRKSGHMVKDFPGKILKIILKLGASFYFTGKDKTFMV